MAETKKSAKTKPIADVAHPGKSAPSDNSRSIVISRPIMQDPMMVDDTTTKASNATVPASANISRELTLEPMTPVPASDQTEEKVETEPKSKPTSKINTEPEPEPGPEPKVETSASDASTEDKSKTSDNADTDPKQPEPEPESDTKTDEDEKAVPQADLESQQAKQAEHEAGIQKIIDSKQYFLPINTVEKRRNARFVALGVVLAVLLGMAWLDIALDAGIIHLGGLKAVTHLFST